MKLLLLLIAGTMALTGPVFADTDPDKRITFRQSGMMFMRWNMGVIKKQVIKKSETYNKKRVEDAARVIAAIANSRIDSLFQSGTDIGRGWKKTRLKSEYFEKPDEVKKHLNQFRLEAGELVRVSRNGDAGQIKDQFDVLLKVCKGCHKKYRVKEKR